MKKTIHLISMLLLVMLIQSCSKSDPCPKGQENYYNLTDEEKSKIPYTGTDTLVFISDKGDTATLIGQGKSQSYKRTTSGGSPDCGAGSYTYENYEKIDYLFNGSNIEFNMLSLTAYRNKSSTYFSYYNFTINNNYNFTNSIYGTNNTAEYFDEVFFQNKIIDCRKITSDKDTTANIFYNYFYGILKIENSTHIWTRK